MTDKDTKSQVCKHSQGEHIQTMPDISPAKDAFEKAFSHLDLTSYGGKAYNSKITNRMWRGFEMAWNIRGAEIQPDVAERGKE